jgi:hypothetical protein
MILSSLVVFAGLGMVVAGAVAAFVSSNSSAASALTAVGAASLLVIVFRDRIQEAKVGGLEIKLAVQVKDQLRSALDLKVKGNYEGAEWEIRQAFERFLGELDVKEYEQYSISRDYQTVVYEMLERLVPKQFGGQVMNSSATNSFFPLVDAVLLLDGARVRRELDERKLDLCPELVAHLDQGELTVGVTIRPGPELEADKLVRRLRTNVQYGALKATCFLLIQNCKDKETGREFRKLAREQGMHATHVVWPAEGTEHELDLAISSAILTICTEALP